MELSSTNIKKNYIFGNETHQFLASTLKILSHQICYIQRHLCQYDETPIPRLSIGTRGPSQTANRDHHQSVPVFPP